MRRGARLFLCMAFLLASMGNVFAATVEERLAALETLVASQRVTIDEQQTTIADLSAQLAAVQANPVLAMGDYVHIDANELNGVRGPHVIFEGVNLHVRSGAGQTLDNWLDEFGNPIYVIVNGTGNPMRSGLGNLIIGYNEIPDNVGNELMLGDRSGSHNLIMGREHKFRSSDSILHGWGSTVDWGGHASAILAGDGTIIGRSYSAAIGGRNHSIIERGVIVGGFENTLNGFQSVIVGGQGNTTVGEYSLITGGQGNAANGNHSSVTGGFERAADGPHDWAAGNLWEDY